MATKKHVATPVDTFVASTVQPKADGEVESIASVCRSLIEQCPESAQQWLLDDILTQLFEAKENLSPAYQAFTTLSDSTFGDALVRYADTERGRTIMYGAAQIAAHAEGPEAIDEYLRPYLPTE